MTVKPRATFEAQLVADLGRVPGTVEEFLSPPSPKVSGTVAELKAQKQRMAAMIGALSAAGETPCDDYLQLVGAVEHAIKVQVKATSRQRPRSSRATRRAACSRRVATRGSPSADSDPEPGPGKAGLMRAAIGLLLVGPLQFQHVGAVLDVFAPEWTPEQRAAFLGGLPRIWREDLALAVHAAAIAIVEEAGDAR